MRDYPNSYPKPDWLPDWRAERSYKDHGDDAEAWAWECLRRSPEYQADYARWAALPDTEIAEDGVSVLTRKYGGTLGSWMRLAFCQADPPAISAEETIGEYECRTGIWPESLHDYLTFKWGMLYLRDPADENAPDWDTQQDFTREMPPYSIPDYCDEVAVSGFNPGHENDAGRLLYAWWPQVHDRYLHTLAFDLRVNIDDQIDVVREILKESQEALKRGDFVGVGPMEVVSRPTKKGRSTLQTDLRILDAKWSGASEDEIMATLWGDTKRPPHPDGGDFERYQHEAMEQRIKDAMGRITRRVIEGGWGDLVRWSLLPQSKKNQKRKPSSPE
jgi:hypothetical protein